MTDYEIALLLKAVAEVVRMQAELVLLASGQVPPGQHLAGNHARVTALVIELAKVARKREVAG